MRGNPDNGKRRAAALTIIAVAVAVAALMVMMAWPAFGQSGVAVAQTDPLTAAFSDAPESHDGSTEFTVKLSFSEDVSGLSYVTLRDHAFDTVGGDVRKANRVTPGSNQDWTITIAPSSLGDVTITLPATTDCNATGAVCNEDGVALSAGDSATIAGPDHDPLTGAFSNAPESHDGSTEFTLKISFSEDVSGLSYVTLRDHAFDTAGGDVRKASRVTPGSNQDWTITIAPSGDGDVSITLPETTDCDATGAVCNEDGVPFSEEISALIPGPNTANQPTPTPTPNSAAAGKPAITGTVQVGETLTVGTSDISDGNGMTDPQFTYQWVKTQGGTDTDITGATASTYVITTADLAHRIKVKVSFTDDDGYSETVTSDATNLVTRPPNSVATGKPAITGTVEVGETLTVGTSDISDGNGMTDPQFTYQWVSTQGGTDADITGATASTYAPTRDDAGNAFKVKVSFTDDDGYSETVTSDATDTLLVAQEQNHDPDPPVCDRDPAVIRAILRKLTNRSTCSQVTSADLSGITGGLHPWADYGMTLESGDFAGLSSVTELTVFAGGYITIKSGAFTGLSALEDMYIQGVAGLGLQAGAFNGLTKLEELHIYQSGLTSLNTDIFTPLTSLKKITLDRNGFTALPTAALDDLTTLETLDMSFNNLRSIPSGLFGGDSAPLTSVKSLVFTANHISSITAGAFDSATELTHLYLGDNDLEALPDDIFDKLTKLKRLELRHNELSAVKRSDFDKLTALEVLNLRYNEISTWPSDLFNDLAALTHLDLRGNGASTMNLSAIDGLTKLNHLDLGANRISTLTATTFSQFTALTYLSLSHNRLTTLPVGIFDAYTNLRTLDLESNSLSGLPANLFEKNTELRKLLMSVNRISSLPDGLLDDNTELRTISLRQNPLSEIPLDFFDELTHLTYLTLPDSIARIPNLRAAELADANTIELTYDLPLKSTGAIRNLLTAKVDGTEREISGVSRTVRRVSITLGGSDLTADDTVTLNYTSVRPDRHLPSGGILAMATPSIFETYYANNMVDLPIRNGLGQTTTGTNTPATGKPTISGTQSVGSTLTAGTSGISDDNGTTSASFTYQWVRTRGTTDTYISNATGSTYVVAEADKGHRIRVWVVFSDDDGYGETVISDATGTIP